MFGLFKKQVDRNCLAKATDLASSKFRESFDSGCDIYGTDLMSVDNAARDISDAQVLLLAILRPTLNFALQDAYVEAGLAGPFERVSAELDADDERQALRSCMAFFPTCRLNVDMRFRYLFVNDLSSPAEDESWQYTVTFCQRLARRSFEEKTQLHCFWVGVLDRLGKEDFDGASQIMSEQI